MLLTAYLLNSYVDFPIIIYFCLAKVWNGEFKLNLLIYSLSVLMSFRLLVIYCIVCVCVCVFQKESCRFCARLVHARSCRSAFVLFRVLRFICGVRPEICVLALIWRLSITDRIDTGGADRLSFLNITEEQKTRQYPDKRGKVQSTSWKIKTKL